MSSGVHASSAHKEKVVQDHLISQLVTGQGYLRRDAKTDYDRGLAMDRALVLSTPTEFSPEVPK